MAAGLNRASVMAINEETTEGTYVAPSAAGDFIPLRPGNEIKYEPVLLESDELLNDIGGAKGLVGSDTCSFAHPAYLRHSGTEGGEPEMGILWESLMGSKDVASTEYDTTSGSTTLKAVMPGGEGANFAAGQALLIKDGTNGYSIRNVSSVSTDDLNFNFQVSNAPASGVNTGKAVMYAPTSSGHPTFSATKYIGNGHAIQVGVGLTVTEASISGEAGQLGTVDFSAEGTKYFQNPISITASTKYIDFTDDSGTWAASVAVDVYNNPEALADALKTAMDDASTETYTVTYSHSTGKFTITYASAATFSILWNTGANAANTIATKIGFSAAANSTGALTYTSADAQTLTAGYTPVYDTADVIVFKSAELFVGGVTDNVCLETQSVSISIGKEVANVDDICEATSVAEKIPVSRKVEMTVVATLQKYDTILLDDIKNNTGISAMLNAGPKSGGNWVAGKCFNMYMQNCTVSDYSVAGDAFAQVTFKLTGFVTSTQKDVYINFI